MVSETGLAASTRVIYTSDHGDNVGQRGLWGKSNLYQESVAVPMIVAGPEVRHGVCRTPVTLLDLFPTILDAVGIDPPSEMDGRPGRSLFAIGDEDDDSHRVVLSEYHAVGSNSGAFMVRKGRWKYHHYVGHTPELFDLVIHPEETRNLAIDGDHQDVCESMEAALRGICDPATVDELAKQDQATLIERHGGRDAARHVGTPGATPPPRN